MPGASPPLVKTPIFLIMLTLDFWESIIQFFCLLIVYQQDFKSIFVLYVTFPQ